MLIIAAEAKAVLLQATDLPPGEIMEAEFWHDRWSSGQLGFHQLEYDAKLVAHWHEIGAAAGSKILVPLCGKSLDMMWLRERGHAVVGVELSSKAVEEFVAENALTTVKRNQDGFDIVQADNIEIWCGDFFALPAHAVEGVTAVYDRGSMVALPPEMRGRYCAKLKNMLPDVSIYLSCVEYNQSEMNGPPFSIPRQEIDQHYSQSFAIELVADEVASDIPDRFRARGLTALSSKGYILRPKGNG